MTLRRHLLPLLLALLPLGADAPPLSTDPAPVVEACFAPGGEPRAVILHEIGVSRETVLVAAYVLTDDTITAALVAAHGRGVRVQVILDTRQSGGRGSDGLKLAAAGIDVESDGRHPIFHDKFVVVDGFTVLAGSYNFSAQAARNGENLLTVRSREIAERYTAAWRSHAVHAEAISWPTP